MRKRWLFIIISLFMMFCMNIDVNAATEEELSKPEFNFPKESNVCVYSTKNLLDIDGAKLPEEFKYVVIIFNKNNEESGSENFDEKNTGNKYGIKDYTLIAGNYAHKTEIQILDGEIYAGEIYGDILDFTKSNVCSDFFVQVDLNTATITPEYNIYLTNKLSEKPKNHYEYDIEKTKNILVNEEIEFESCVFKIDDERHQIISYDSSNNFFGTTNNKIVCPAKIENGYDFKTISININKFQCSDWKIEKNKNFNTGFNEYPLCEYFLVNKNAYVINGEESELEQEGNYITKYIAYRNDTSPSISLIKEDDGTIKAILKEGRKESKINISNINDFITIFLSDSEDAKKNYPKYLNYYENKTYKLSSDKDKNAKTSYIIISSLSSYSGFDENLTIETCEDLVGGTFITFLKNNVFKVIYIGIPILLIVLTSFDFAKVVFIDDKEGIQGAAKKFGKRAIIAILIYLIPTILIFLTNIFSANEVKMCVEAFKNEVNSSN